MDTDVVSILGSRKDARKMHGVFWIVGWHPTIMDRGLNKYKLVSFAGHTRTKKAVSPLILDLPLK